jgi:hypothetical protein
VAGTVILDTGVEVTILFDRRAGPAFVAAFMTPFVFLRRQLDLDVVSGRRETISVMT